MKKLIFFFLLSSFMFSCHSDEEKKIAKENEEHYLKREKIINELIARYNIQYNWDTIVHHRYYSIDFKPALDSKCQLLTDYKIDDIYEKDSAVHVSIETKDRFNLKPILYFDFPLTDEQAKIFVKNSDLILVTSIAEISRIKFSRNGEYYGYEEGYDEKVKEFSHNFSGRGKIIAIRSISDSGNISLDTPENIPK